MFGEGSGYALPLTNFTLTVTVGGMQRKPAVVEDEIVIREIINLTISFDHDIIDGAPAARFVQSFRNIIERAEGLHSIASKSSGAGG